MHLQSPLLYTLIAVLVLVIVVLIGRNSRLAEKARQIDAEKPIREWLDKIDAAQSDQSLLDAGHPPPEWSGFPGVRLAIQRQRRAQWSLDRARDAREMYGQLQLITNDRELLEGLGEFRRRYEMIFSQLEPTIVARTRQRESELAAQLMQRLLGEARTGNPRSFQELLQYIKQYESADIARFIYPDDWAELSQQFIRLRR